MIYPGGKQCTSNNYLILCAAIISCASWHHFSNGCFIPTIWLMSHCAVSLLSLNVTNDNGRDFSFSSLSLKMIFIVEPVLPRLSPVSPSEEVPRWHRARLQEHRAPLQRTPLGGAEILSSSALPASRGLPWMSLVWLLLKASRHKAGRFTLPGLIVFWRKNTVTMRLSWAWEVPL